MTEIIHKDLSYKITGLCFKVHNELGRFCRKRQYADKIEEMFKKEKLSYKREVEIVKLDNDSPKGNIADFIIEDKAIVDLEAKRLITKEDYYQMQRYLKGANLKLGLIVNFRNRYLKPKRVLNSDANLQISDANLRIHTNATNSRHSRINSRYSHRSRGFTLIELVLYVALTSIFISGAILFAWDIIYGRVKSQVQQEVSQNLRLASQRIVYEVRNASDINSVGANDICLASGDSSRNPTKFYIDSGRLRIGWGGGSVDCTGLTSDEPLTSNQVTVSALTFEDLSTVGEESKNIEFSITIESTGDRQEWQKSQTYSTAVELRSN